MKKRSMIGYIETRSKYLRAPICELEKSTRKSTKIHFLPCRKGDEINFLHQIDPKTVSVIVLNLN